MFVSRDDVRGDDGNAGSAPERRNDVTAVTKDNLLRASIINVFLDKTSLVIFPVHLLTFQFKRNAACSTKADPLFTTRGRQTFTNLHVKRAEFRRRL